MKHIIISRIQIFINILLILGLLIQIPDLIGSSNYIYQKINITSNTIIFLFITLAGIWRVIKNNQLFHSKLNLFLLLSSILFCILSIVMTIVDNIQYLNYVYNLTRINYDQIGFFSFTLFSIWIINQPNKFFSLHKKQLILLTPFFIFFIFYMMGHWPYDVLKKSLSEDGQVESIQVLFLLISSALSIAISRYLKIKRNVYLSVLYMFITFGLLFIAGEEISWGQRIFNITTPDTLKEINRQNEITLHNIHGIENMVRNLYILLSMYCAFGFMLIPVLSKFASREILDFLIPRKYYLFYFLPIIIYQTSPLRGIIPYIPEVVELFFYTGIMVFLLENYFCLQKSTKVSKKK